MTSLSCRRLLPLQVFIPTAPLSPFIGYLERAFSGKNAKKSAPTRQSPVARTRKSAGERSLSIAVRLARAIARPYLMVVMRRVLLDHPTGAENIHECPVTHLKIGNNACEISGALSLVSPFNECSTGATRMKSCFRCQI